MSGRNWHWCAECFRGGQPRDAQHSGGRRSVGCQDAHESCESDGPGFEAGL